MRLMQGLVLAALVSSFSSLATTLNDSLTELEISELKTLINSDKRTDKQKQRNKYRHPLETLTFFGVKENHTVVEIWPGGKGGWYRSILEPYIEGTGLYVPVRSSDDFPEPIDKVADNSADRVLVFRAHGFMIYDNPAQAYFDSLYKMLKPGGIFGIVDHRGNEAIPQDPKGENGYVNQSHVIKLAEKAGFVLVDSAEINANAKDTKDYPKGLYSLPPSLRGSMFDSELRKQVLAIGESDRMTLKFTKK
ncbi:class I SAM-dependent methyltransferase [Alteromonas sp. 5E99-2]|nr:class I SAM-dependent methyltransferase [Alteromonas sp. 5E99-2]